MKIFKLMVVALVAMIGLNSCSKDCNHDFIERDYSNDIVGTWTCLKADFAEALVFRADGTFSSVGVAGGEYWEYPNATWTLKNNKLALSSGDYKSNVVLEIIPGNCLALVDEKGNRNVFTYCANDLADEVVGMWVCNDGHPEGTNDIAITTYTEDGKMLMTHSSPDGSISWLNKESDYVLVGDLMIHIFPNVAVDGSSMFLATRLIYTPDGTNFGDILTQKKCVPTENGFIESTSSFLRINQYLDLAGKKYDYIKTFVSNVDGLDKDIEFLGHTFNFAKMDNTMFDKMLKNLLFAVEFPDANTIKYNLYYNNKLVALDLPIVVEGNKMTVKMSEVYSAAKDVDLYTFQDADCSQMHMYMPTYSFINFFGNMQIAIMTQFGQLDANDTAAVKAVFDSIDEAVNTINVSFVMSKTK